MYISFGSIPNNLITQEWKKRNYFESNFLNENSQWVSQGCGGLMEDKQAGYSPPAWWVVQWLRWVFATQERKKERKKEIPCPGKGPHQFHSFENLRSFKRHQTLPCDRVQHTATHCNTEKQIEVIEFTLGNKGRSFKRHQTLSQGTFVYFDFVPAKIEARS